MIKTCVIKWVSVKSLRIHRHSVKGMYRYDYKYTTSSGFSGSERTGGSVKVSHPYDLNTSKTDYVLYSVRHLVLDEADRMLDAEFLDQVKEVVAGCTRERVQKAVFSATLPSGAETIAMDMMDDPIRVVVGLKYIPLLRAIGSPETDFILLKGYAVATHRPIFDLRRRRLLEAANLAPVLGTAI